MVPTNEETPEFLAIAQILRSKRNAAKLIKAYKGQPFDILVKAAREYKKELQVRKLAARVATPESEDDLRRRKEWLFVLRTMALSGLPHSKHKSSFMEREVRYGPTQWVKMRLTAREFDKGIDLPYGLNARRVIIMLCTIAVETQSPFITLDSAIDFMQRMGWKLHDTGKNIQGYYYRSLRSILEGLQMMTVDMEYHGIFNRKGKTRDSYSIIRRYHLPSVNADHAHQEGEQPLYGVEEIEEDPELGPPGLFWVRLDPLFFEDLVGNPANGVGGQAFPFTHAYLSNFRSSKEIDIALFLAARCSAADSRSVMDLHALWDQLGIDQSNYSMFKKLFKETLAEVKRVWDGCIAEVDSEKDRFIVEPVPPGKEMVPRALADSLMADFLSVSPATRAKQYIEMAQDGGAE